MKVLIYEPNIAGHRLHYVRLMVEGLVAQHYQVELAATRGNEKSPNWGEFLQPVESSFSTQFLPPRKGKLGYFTQSRDFGEIIIQSNPDCMIIPYADTTIWGLWTAILLNGKFRHFARRKAVLLYFRRGEPAYPRRSLRMRLFSRVKEYASAWLPIENCYDLDPMVEEVPRVAATSLGIFPDPCEDFPLLDKNACRRELNLPEDKILLGIVGGIDSRKGVAELIEAARYAEKFAGQKIAFCLVGVHKEETHKKVQEYNTTRDSRSAEIFSRDGYFELETNHKYVCALDGTLVIYPSHIGSASSVIRSAKAQRPVLGTCYGWIGKAVKENELGWVTDPCNPDMLAKDILAFAANCQAWQPTERTRKFTQFHTVENFQATWVIAVERAVKA